MRHLQKTINGVKGILAEQGSFKQRGATYCTYDASFIPPIGFTLLASFHKKNPGTLSLESFLNADVRTFMERANLFYVTGVSKSPSHYSGQSLNLLETRSVTNKGETDEIANKVMRMGESVVHAIEDGNYFLPNLDYVTMELLNNVADHSSDMSTNFVSAANFNNCSSPHFQVAVADSGIGILNDISKLHSSVIDHESAIIKALEKRVSGKLVDNPYGESTNAGLGLTVTSRLIHSNCGDFVIGTGDALYYTDSVSQKWHMEKIPNWNGTFVFFNSYPYKINIYGYRDILDSIYKEIPEIELDIDFG